MLLFFVTSSQTSSGRFVCCRSTIVDWSLQTLKPTWLGLNNEIEVVYTKEGGVHLERIRVSTYSSDPDTARSVVFETVITVDGSSRLRETPCYTPTPVVCTEKNF